MKNQLKKQTIATLDRRATNLAEGIATGGDDTKANDENGSGNAIEDDLAQHPQQCPNCHHEETADNKRGKVDWLLKHLNTPKLVQIQTLTTAPN